jgi:hypothetical protein
VEIARQGVDHAGTGVVPVLAVGEREAGGQVDVENLAGGLASRPGESVDAVAKAMLAHQRGIAEIDPVGGPDAHQVVDRLETIELGQQRAQHAAIDVLADPLAARAVAVELLEEHDHEVRGGPNQREEPPYAPLRLAVVGAAQRAGLDVQELRAGTGFGHVARDGAGDECLADPGRTDQRDPAQHLQLVLRHLLPVDHVQVQVALDLGDHIVVTADPLEADRGGRLEHVLALLALGDVLDHARHLARVEHAVPGLQRRGQLRIAENRHLLVARSLDQDPIVQHLGHGPHQSAARRLRAAAHHQAEVAVEVYLVTAVERFCLHLGEGHHDLPPASAVDVEPIVPAVGKHRRRDPGRLAQPLQLLLRLRALLLLLLDLPFQLPPLVGHQSAHQEQRLGLGVGENLDQLVLIIGGQLALHQHLSHLGIRHGYPLCSSDTAKERSASFPLFQP